MLPNSLRELLKYKFGHSISALNTCQQLPITTRMKSNHFSWFLGPTCFAPISPNTLLCLAPNSSCSPLSLTRTNHSHSCVRTLDMPNLLLRNLFLQIFQDGCYPLGFNSEVTISKRPVPSYINGLSTLNSLFIIPLVSLLVFPPATV